MYDHALKINQNDAKTYFNKGFLFINIKKEMHSINWKNIMRLSKCMRYLTKLILMTSVKIS